MRQKNFLLFFVLSFLLFIIWQGVRQRFWPPPPAPTASPETLAKLSAPEVQRPLLSLTKMGLPDVNRSAVQGVTAAAVATLSTAPNPPSLVALRMRDSPKEFLPLLSLAQMNDINRAAAQNLTSVAWAKLSTVPKHGLGRPYTLGSADPKSKYHMRLICDSRGGTVRSVLLNKLRATDELGRPVPEDPDRPESGLLELVPEEANSDNPSHQLLHYDPPDLAEERPVDTLGQIEWTVVDEKDKPLAEAGPAGKGVRDDGTSQSISFKAMVPDGSVEIIKTYSLRQGEYHIGLEVKMIPRSKTAGGKDPRIRYQLTGAHGLPIEGWWYTSIFRNALIAQEVNGSVDRKIQDIRQLMNWNGGEEVRRQQGGILRYAGVAIQYFASVIVVDNENQKKQDFLLSARPTLETTLVRGRIAKVDRAQGTFILHTDDPKTPELTFILDDQRQFRRSVRLEPGESVAVAYTTDSQFRNIPTNITRPYLQQPQLVDDITVRVNTEVVEFKDNEPVVHRYLLYNGPVKPSLLGFMPASDRPSDELIDRYAHTLHLNTLTDYHMPGGWGWFLSFWWTPLVIKCTNLMHWVLAHLYFVIPNYGLCIILLTVLVRGVMFPFSRKQAIMGMKMQELAPEMKKLQEKYKDDRQKLGVAQMELYRKHGINPFGTCWLLLLQMPVFMGLYYALQESIQFRLAPFWPTWIVNLAAPDMMVYWGQNIPLISQPDNYGSILFLGPFLNLLPIIAIILTLMMQKMMTPPPTDEQQEMQQKMMKYMMIFFGLMFYKLAGGVCIYFIASSLWGVAERKFLPKKQTAPGTASAGAPPRPTGQGQPVAASTGIAGDERGRRGKQKRQRKREQRGQRDSSVSTASAIKPEDEAGALGKLRAWWKARRERWGEWWTELLKKAEKK
jgi:YidC/Oxa1 family membrane protein insertase